MQTFKFKISPISIQQCIICLCIVMTCLNPIKGQEGGEELSTEQLEVIKSFDAKLEEATIVDIRPRLPLLTPVKKAYRYNISVVPLSIEYPDPIIKPLAMNDQAEFKSYNHYFEGGYGTRNNYQGRLLSSYGLGDRYRINVDGSYFALDNSKEVAHQQMQDIHGRINGWARLNENIKLDFNGGYRGVERNWFDTRDFSTILLGRSRFNNVLQGGLHFSNLAASDLGINFNFGADTYLLFNDIDGREISYSINGEISKRRSDRINLVLPLEIQLVNNELFDKGIVTIHTAPAVHFNYGLFQLNAGVDYVYSNTDVNSIWPEVEAAYGLARGYIQPFIGVGQSHYINSLNNLIQASPFLQFEDYNASIAVTQNYYGGVRGELNFLSYEAEVGYASISDQALFNNRLDLDGEHVSLIATFEELMTTYLKGVINFKFSQQMDIGGDLTKHFYNRPQDLPAFGLPSLQAHAYIKYSLIKDKLMVSGDLYLADQTPVTIIDESTMFNSALNNQVELNASVNYWPIKNVGIEAYGRNLLNNKYQRWHGYPIVGINAGAKLMVKF